MVEAVERYLDGVRVISWNSGNTEAFVDSESSLIITLCGKQIAKLQANKDGDIESLFIYSGEAYDQYGNITYMTQERLNGLFDCLEHNSIIPHNVRVFISKEDEISYLAFNEKKIPFNKEYCTMLKIKASPKVFTVEDMRK